MPEGDTIFRTAAVLQRALLGMEIVAAASIDPRGGRDRSATLVERRVEAVEARGKHIVIGFSGGIQLRTHLGMTGSWHLYRPGEPWQRPRAQASVVLETSELVAVCFSASTIEITRGASANSLPTIQRLGPDLMAEQPDLAEAVRRLRSRGEEEIGVALLDQQALAGIGNVYKSEALFLTGHHPWTPVSALDDGALLALVELARALLLANAHRGPRRTTASLDPSARLWVYGRRGRSCRRCGAVIRSGRLGPHARSTYWCPACQPSRDASHGERANRADP
jgi:endonuclease-8